MPFEIKTDWTITWEVVLAVVSIVLTLVGADTIRRQARGILLAIIWGIVGVVLGWIAGGFDSPITWLIFWLILGGVLGLNIGLFFNHYYGLSLTGVFLWGVVGAIAGAVVGVLSLLRYGPIYSSVIGGFIGILSGVIASKYELKGIIDIIERTDAGIARGIETGNLYSGFVLVELSIVTLVLTFVAATQKQWPAVGIFVLLLLLPHLVVLLGRRGMVHRGPKHKH